jgi:uncharacterized alkaline shock family protein YloU
VSHVIDGITITDGALAQIVSAAVEQVDGVRVRRRGVAFEEGRVSVSLAARYGTVLPQLAREVQERVAGALSSMCELQVGVDVSLEELDE